MNLLYPLQALIIAATFFSNTNSQTTIKKSTSQSNVDYDVGKATSLVGLSLLNHNRNAFFGAINSDSKGNNSASTPSSSQSLSARVVERAENLLNNSRNAFFGAINSDSKGNNSASMPSSSPSLSARVVERAESLLNHSRNAFFSEINSDSKGNNSASKASSSPSPSARVVERAETEEKSTKVSASEKAKRNTSSTPGTVTASIPQSLESNSILKPEAAAFAKSSQTAPSNNVNSHRSGEANTRTRLVSLDSENITRCTQETETDHTYSITLVHDPAFPEIVVSVRYRGSGSTATNRTFFGSCAIFILTENTPDTAYLVRISKFKVTSAAPEGETGVKATVGNIFDQPMLNFEGRLVHPALILTVWGNISVTLLSQYYPQSLDLDFSYRAVKHRSGTPFDLEVSWSSSTAATIRPPYWDSHTHFFTESVRMEVNLPVPTDHEVMVSFEHLGINYGIMCEVSLRIEPDRQDSQVLAFCGHLTPPAFTVRCQQFYVSYVPMLRSASKGLNTGFSMRVSYHHDSALPQRLAGGLWNCSGPHWADFKQHLLCNLITECAGGEDEVGCPYSSEETCGPDYLAAGGSCFFYPSTPPSYFSWNDAASLCRSKGGHLPTLNTPDKWRAVLDLLSNRNWEKVFVGLTSVPPYLPYHYRLFSLWEDYSVAYYMLADFVLPGRPNCAFLRVERQPGILYMDSCQEMVIGDVLCEVQFSSDLRIEISTPEKMVSTRKGYVDCPRGHVTHDFLSCDHRSDCWDSDHETCSEAMSMSRSFRCESFAEWLPFPLVCDHREDCIDGSDENFCVFPACPEFTCDNKQCIPYSKRCDAVEDCADNSDEKTCAHTLMNFTLVNMTTPLPAIAVLDGKGHYNLFQVDAGLANSDAADGGLLCPETHFPCPGVRYYCLPVYVRCNGVYDCPGHEDEAYCHSVTCPGFYRCRGSKLCLHDSHVCDGVYHCPERDDELLCGLECPLGCTCFGLAFHCTRPFLAASHPDLRFLDAGGSGMTLKALATNTMLLHLNLARSNITSLDTMRFVNMYHLDLSYNLITRISTLHILACKNLQTLNLAANPLISIFNNLLTGNVSFPQLNTLDLSFVSFKAINLSRFDIFPNVLKLNISNTGLNTVTRESGFSAFKRMRVLDLSGCPMTFFAQNMFTGLSDLSELYADNYKLCCPAILPDGFNVLDCHAPVDEVSSCQGLLKSGLYRVALAVLTLLIVVGNLSSFVYRVVISRDKNRTSFGLFVTNLCVSDFLMGVYSAIIGVADRVYLEDYLWSDVTWRNSTFCKMAGFLSLLSNEVSAFIICLVTVDRFLVTRFPLSHHLHFSLRSARGACAAVWTAGVLLASVPLLPVTSHWEFYSQTGICIPLPITRKRFDGHSYSYGILIILNLVIFVLIAVGQMSIYWSVKANSMAATDTTQKSRDLVIGRRLITVAVSDFLCWFPVGLLGLLASAGHPIPGEANVAIAIFVLPLNSALNPFLYTVNVIMERRQKAREIRLQKILLARLGTQNTERSKVPEGMYSKEEGKRFLQNIVISGVLTREDVLQITNSAADEQRNV